ncbi:MAG: hypothetical protein QXE01_05550 [Sulfolobales archaeon]
MSLRFSGFLSGQSELLSSVILVVLVLIIGLSGFFLANSWVSQRYSENAFTYFADLCLSEFQASLISIENRSSTRIVYVGVLRVGILSDSYSVGVSIYNSSAVTPTWWLLRQVDPSRVGYNLSLSNRFLGNLSFNPLQISSSVSPQYLYAKYGGSWVSLRDMGLQNSINIYSLGLIGPSHLLVLNISISDPNTRYLYIVMWTRFNDRYVATPLLVPLT